MDLNAELRDLLVAGRKIQAIKRYREATGANLIEAKTAVEALERSEVLPGEQPLDPAAGQKVEKQIVGLLGQGNRKEAILAYRRWSKGGLFEARQAVDAIAAKHGLQLPTKIGCLPSLLLLVGIALTVGLFAT